MFTGGGSQGRDWGDALTQLLAWPVLLLAVWQLVSTPAPRGRFGVLALAATVPATLALQWLTGWSLAPWATERALWSVLPAVAAFLAALALPRRELQRLAWLFVALAAFSLALGYLQLGAPQDSLLNPFPEWPPALNGLYANPNHQATSIALALVIVLAWLMHDDQEMRDGRWWATRIAVGGLGLFLLVGLPLTGSRGAVLAAVAGLLLVPVANGWLGRRWRRQRRLAMFAGIGGVLATALLLLAAHGWLKVDRQEESRSAVFAATVQMAREASPGGIGTGAFVPWFEAHAPDALVQWEFFNHAHSEYPQWWLESGVAGLAWIVALGVLVAGSRPRPGRGRRPEWLHVGAWVGVLVVLAHSAVDYPLRTPALMTVSALLAGIAATHAMGCSRRQVGADGTPTGDATIPRMERPSTAA